MSAEKGVSPALERDGAQICVTGKRRGSSKPSSEEFQANSWRDVLPVHPAAELFPMMSRDEVLALGKDIKDGGADGLRMPITLVKWAKSPVKVGRTPVALLDGRNRLDALEAVGYKILFTDGGMWLAEKRGAENVGIDLIGVRADPYERVLSLNIHRRHLTAEQKRELIAKVLKAKPKASNRQIAKQVKADDKTVAKVRKELEGRSEIPHVETRTDTKGRKQPAKRTRKPIEHEDGPGEDAQTIWRRGLLNRAEIAAGDALYEDWSQFKVDAEVVDAARRTAAAWLELADYLASLAKPTVGRNDDDLNIRPFLRRGAS